MKKFLMILICVLLLVACQDNEAGAGNELNSPESTVNQDNVSNEAVDTNETKPIVEEVREYTDVLGRTISLDAKPERVISLYASFADLWYEAGGELVGIVDSSTLPEKAADLPKLGKMSAPNVEAILALEPDLIIVRAGYAKQEDLIELFVNSGINVFCVDYNNFTETMTVYKDFCLINEREDLYEEKALAMIETVDSYQAMDDFTYLLMFATSKSISTKDDNTTAFIIDELGGKNITKEYQIADEETKQFSFEKILEANPKFIFVQTMGSVEDARARMEADIISNPAWSSLDAVKEGRFIYLPKDLFLYKPNMRYLEAYDYIIELLGK